MMRWIRMAGAAVAAAGLVSVVLSLLGLSATLLPGGIPVATAAPVAGLLAGLLAAVLVDGIWGRWRTWARTIEELERRVTLLEQTSVGPPPRVTFEYDSNTLLARLHVTNDGTDADFRARLLVDGQLSMRLDREVFVRWEHTDQPHTAISRGTTRTLRLARLDVSAFPFAQWHIDAVTDDGPTMLPAVDVSVIGGAPDMQAAPLFLEVSIFQSGASVACVYTCTIALYPFEAQRLSPHRHF
jgi:hypothetical protein